MLVEPDPVVAELVEGLPRLEVLLVGAHRHLGLEVAPGQGPRQLIALLQVVEMLAVG
jgi:hypothetical protein